MNHVDVTTTVVEVITTVVETATSGSGASVDRWIELTLSLLALTAAVAAALWARVAARAQQEANRVARVGLPVRFQSELLLGQRNSSGVPHASQITIALGGESVPVWVHRVSVRLAFYMRYAEDVEDRYPVLTEWRRPTLDIGAVPIRLHPGGPPLRIEDPYREKHRGGPVDLEWSQLYLDVAFSPTQDEAPHLEVPVEVDLNCLGPTLADTEEVRAQEDAAG